MTNASDTLAAHSICKAMAEFQQLAGLVVGITTALNEPAVAAEVLRMVEEVMDSRGDLAEYRKLRDDANRGLDDLRAYLDG